MVTKEEYRKKEKRELWLVVLLLCGSTSLIVFEVKKGWIQSEGEWGQAGTNVTLTQVDHEIVAAEGSDENGRMEEAALLHVQLLANFGTNLIPVAKLDEYLDAESNVLKAVELKVKASFETNSP